MSSSIASQTNQTEEEKNFLEELKSIDYRAYAYRKDAIRFPVESDETLSIIFRPWINKNGGKLGPNIKGIDLGSVKHYSYSELQQITNSFSQSNLICRTARGRLFEGTIKQASADQHVIVKTWIFSLPGSEITVTSPARFHDELQFLRIPEIEAHPNVVKLIGYHCDEKLAFVYEGIRPKYILDQVLEDDKLDWDDRLNVAIGVGKILKTFHDNNTVHGGIFPGCIMLDENLCPKTFDFQQLKNNIWSYEEELLGLKDGEAPELSFKDDVFLYGLLLLELISKKDQNRVLTSWYKDFSSDSSDYGAFVHESFSIPVDIASRMTRCGFDCLRARSDMQPSLDEVLKMLADFASPPAKKKQKYDN